MKPLSGSGLRLRRVMPKLSTLCAVHISYAVEALKRYRRAVEQSRTGFIDVKAQLRFSSYVLLAAIA